MSAYRTLLLFNALCWGLLATYRAYRFITLRHPQIFPTIVSSVVATCFFLHLAGSLPWMVRNAALAAATLAGPVGIIMIVFMELEQRRAR